MGVVAYGLHMAFLVSHLLTFGVNLGLSVGSGVLEGCVVCCAINCGDKKLNELLATVSFKGYVIIMPSE